jgi:hypothetical protein
MPKGVENKTGKEGFSQMVILLSMMILLPLNYVGLVLGSW